MFMDVHVLHKMFACPCCLTNPTRSIHTWLSMCPSVPHFCPATVTIPHRQGRCAPPTSPNHWAQHPLHRVVISGWLPWPLLDLFVCLLRELFVCCLPAELFSACIQSVGCPAPLLDGISLTCKPAESAWFSWQIPSTTRTISRC